MPTDGERIATLEEAVRNVVRDVADLDAQTDRTRKRLHDLEGLTGALVEVNRQRELAATKRQRRTEIRVEILTVVVVVATFAEPFLHHVAR